MLEKNSFQPQQLIIKITLTDGADKSNEQNAQRMQNLMNTENINISEFGLSSMHNTFLK